MVAKDLSTAQKAANLVKVEYEDIHPVILSIEDAIEHKSFFYDPYLVINKEDNLDQVEWCIRDMSAIISQRKMVLRCLRKHHTFWKANVGWVGKNISTLRRKA